LGAERGKTDSETFGLELLSGLLGRLNGKSNEQLSKEESARRDVKLRRYHGEKHGLMGFVFGGYLIGDEIKKSVDQAETKFIRLDIKAKKRESEDDGSTAIINMTIPDSRIAAETEEIEKASEETLSDKRRRRAERKARKETRRLRREEKKKKKAQFSSVTEASLQSQDVTDNANNRNEDITTAAPTRSNTSIQLFSGGRGRNVIRQRYIQQKRMACLDEKALKEVGDCHKFCSCTGTSYTYCVQIFMIKSSG